MSEFAGGKKVRCIDCVKLDGNRCLSKQVKVSTRKRRNCGVYQFQGEYSNRATAKALYIPPVTKQTRNLLKKLVRLGVSPSPDDGSIKTSQTKPGFYKKDILEIPKTTATAPSSDDLVPMSHRKSWMQPTSIVDPNTEIWASPETKDVAEDDDGK